MTSVQLDTPTVRDTRPPTRVGRRYLVRTFGCQMNEHDSERVSGLLESGGMVRIGAAHYNTEEEVRKLVSALDEIL